MKQQKAQQHKVFKNEQQKAGESNRTNILQAAALLAGSCALLIVAFVALSKIGFFHMAFSWTVPRGTVIVGVIDEEGQITSIPEGEIRFRLNRDVYFENPYSRGTIMLENPKVSSYYLEFSFYLQKDNETAVYVSPRLSPGECLLTDKLTSRVPKGYYLATCVVSAYDKNGKYCGKNTAAVNINIAEN